jgi:hypothetical protein
MRLRRLLEFDALFDAERYRRRHHPDDTIRRRERGTGGVSLPKPNPHISQLNIPKHFQKYAQIQVSLQPLHFSFVDKDFTKKRLFVYQKQYRIDSNFLNAK